MAAIKHHRTSLVPSESHHPSQNLHTEAAPAALPEFGDAQTVKALFDISKSHLYRLLEDGLIRSVSLKGRGKSRGRRLYNIASIRALLFESMEADVQPKEGAL